MEQSHPAFISYVPVVPGAVRAEVQRLAPEHPVRGWGNHAHTDFFELLVFDRAGGRHLMDGRNHDVQPGQVVAVRPGVPHDLGGLGSGSGWVLVFAPESVGLTPTATAAGRYATEPLLAPFVGESPALDHLVLPPVQLGRWQQLLGLMAGEQSTGQPQQAVAIRSLLNLLLVEAARLCPPAPVDLRVIPLLEQVFAVIDDGFRTGLSLKDVAASVHRSPAHLTAVVRRATGRPVGEWIIQRRMVEARHRLLGTDATVREVATEAGYTDVVSFARQFRARHGSSPGAWRAHARNGGGLPPATAS